MVLAFTGALNPVIVLVLVGLMGLVRPSDLGLRAALVADTMPQDTLTGAMGFNRITSDSARIAGALTGAGLVALVGMGPAYVVIALFYALAALLTSQADSAHSKRATEPVTATATGRVSAWTDLRDGIVYIWNTPSLLADHQLRSPVQSVCVSADQPPAPFCRARRLWCRSGGLELSDREYLARRHDWRVADGPGRDRQAFARDGRLCHAVARAADWSLRRWRPWPAELAAMFVVGIAQSLAMVSLTVILVREAGPRFRGRVMGVRMLAIYTLPIGLLLAGALIERIEWAATATLYAIVGLLVSVIIALRWRTALLQVVEPAKAA